MTLEIWIGSRLHETCVDVGDREDADNRITMLYGKPSSRLFECVLIDDSGKEIDRW